MTKDEFLELLKQPRMMTILSTWNALMKEEKCPECSYKVKWMRALPGDTKTSFQNRFNTEFLFHMKDTHGIPPEIIIRRIYDELFKQEVAHAIH